MSFANELAKECRIEIEDRLRIFLGVDGDEIVGRYIQRAIDSTNSQRDLGEYYDDHGNVR